MARRLPSQPPVLPGFSNVRILGSGGFADVFLYEQNMPRRQVAVKVMLSEVLAQLPAGTRREIDALAVTVEVLYEEQCLQFVLAHSNACRALEREDMQARTGGNEVLRRALDYLPVEEVRHDTVLERHDCLPETTPSLLAPGLPPGQGWIL